MLNAGQVAPFSGYLVSKERVLEFKKADIELKELRLVNESLNRSVSLYKSNETHMQDQTTLLLNRNDILSKELMSTRSVTQWEKTAWFVGGILVTGAATFGAAKLIK